LRTRRAGAVELLCPCTKSTHAASK
jgi:hypothetical protein